MNGFTSMTEQLMEHGKAGAEILSQILGRILSRSIHEIYGRGGLIAQFEGDSIIAVFPEYPPVAAYNAATSLMDYFKQNCIRRTRFGTWKVSASFALAHGSVEWGIAGRERLIHYIRGDAISRAALLSKQGDAGQLLIDTSFFEFTGYGSIEDFNHIPRDRTEIIHQDLQRIQRKVASKFVPDLIISSKLTGEFREITTVFLSLRTGEYENIDHSVRSILEAASFYGGHVCGLHFTSDYPVILVLFGAPVSWENNSARACSFASELIKSQFSSSIRIGIASGTVYAGMTGNSKRCTYTVYGDVINTAARLLFRADWGDILVTEKTCEKAGSEYVWSDITSLMLRGKTESTRARKLLYCQNNGINRIYEGEMVGRSAELNYIINRISPLKHGAFAGMTLVYGEAGIGKSRLLFEAVKTLAPICQTVVLKCDDILKISLNPFEYFLRNYFQQSDSNTTDFNKKLFEEKMRSIVSILESGSHTSENKTLAEDLRRSISIIGSLLGHFWKDSVFDRMEPGQRFENIAVAIETFIRYLSTLKPLIILIEDLHWMDSDSKRLLQMIIKDTKRNPVAILVSSRYRDNGSRPETEIEAFISTESIDLNPIDEKASVSIITARLNAESGPELTRFILDRTEGNPFYIDQFCIYLKNSDMITFKSGAWHLIKREVEVPSGIKSILVARIDRLPGKLRSLVQIASILGQEFDISVLSEVSGETTVNSLLRNGIEERLWSRISETEYSFNHALYRDASYGMILEKELRKHHRKAAETIIRLNIDDTEQVAGKIAFHMDNSGQSSEALDWGWKALTVADRNYRLYECLDWVNKLQEKLMTDNDSTGRNELLQSVLFKKNSALSNLGRHKEQKENIELLKKLCREENWKDRTIDLHIIQAHYYSSIGKTNKAFALYEKGLSAAEKAGDKKSEAMILDNIGILHRGAGNIDEAEKCYRRALNFYRETGDRREEGKTLGNLALLIRQQGLKSKSETLYRKALKIHREVGNRRAEGYVLNGLGNLQEDDEKALFWFRNALRINREVGDRRAIAIALGNIGQIESNRGNYSTATDNLNIALKIFREIDNLPLQAGTLQIFGEMYILQGKLREAHKCLQDSLEITRQTGRKRLETMVTVQLGLVSALKGDTEKALRLYSTAYDFIMKHEFSKEINEDFSRLRSLLLKTDVEEDNLPWPDIWDIQESKPNERG
jgi:tetratricopeptide (TPR) repeat protein/class 3 adenylate cyclase